jgi:peptidoglycan/LPS O-acetylase OafA/YrhL
MNFQTMSKQRKMILIAAAVGAISMFLPWISVFGYSVSGMHGAGILVFLCFVAAGVIAFMGNQTQNLDTKNWMLVLIASGLAALIMVINFLSALDTLGYMGIGFYLALAASVALVYFAYTLRSPGDTMQRGLDVLKGGLGNSTNTTRTDTHTKVVNPTNDPSKPVI